MKKTQPHTYFHRSLTFQTTFRFHLCRGKNANSSEQQDFSEEPTRQARVYLPYKTKSVYEDPL